MVHFATRRSPRGMTVNRVFEAARRFCYLKNVVEPAFLDLQQNPNSARHACQACVAVYHTPRERGCSSTCSTNGLPFMCSRELMKPPTRVS